MNKKYSLMLSLLVAGVIAANVFYFSAASETTRKDKVVISRVVDGDTVETSEKTKIRLVNVNTPEKGEPGSNLGKDYLRQYVNRTIQFQSLGKDRYGRDLRRLFSGDKYLNLELVANGYANKFLVQRSERAAFAKAEKEAVERGLGIWKHSKYWGCFVSTIDAKKEIVTLTNTCQTKNASILAKGWVIKDEGTKRYTLPNVTLGRITIHSGLGNSTSSTVYLNSKSNIWNDDADTFILFDNDTKVAHYNTYH
jgi:endonuclease YncB( thermonuclease family)